MADNKGAKPYLLEVDPAQVLAHPHNVREDLGDVSGLRESIEQSGVGLVQFPVLIPQEDGLYVLAGHRRMKAEAQAGRKVWCTIRPDLVGVSVSEQLIAMLNENGQRKDLTPTEESRAYEQLTLYGLSEDEIAKKTGHDEPFVRGQLALARLPQRAHDMAARDKLTLEDAADIASLSDDAKVLDRILGKGDNPWGIRQVINEETSKRERKAQAQETLTRLTDAGATLIKKPKGWPHNCSQASVKDLVDPDGNSPDPEAAALQPGFGVFIDPSNGFPVVQVVCLNPKASGLTRKPSLYGPTPEQRAEREAKAEADKLFFEQLDVAAEVRRRFLTEHYGTAGSMKALTREVLHDLATGRHPLVTGYRNPEGRDLVRTLVGGDPTDIPAGARVDRVTAAIAARWLAAREQAVRDMESNWRRDDTVAEAAEFLDRLVAAGYSLSDPEQTLRDQLAVMLAPVRTSPDQLDARCDECGAEVDAPCAEDCELRFGGDQLDDAELDGAEAPDEEPDAPGVADETPEGALDPADTTDH